MHQWGEEDFDWEALENAISYIAKRFRRYKIGVHQAKEKFGTARIYCNLGWHQLHSITHPGHCYSRYPKWLWHLDCIYGTRAIPFLFNWLVIPFHKWIYRDTYKKACDKYPHIKKEICCVADYVELLDFYESNRKEVK